MLAPPPRGAAGRPGGDPGRGRGGVLPGRGGAAAGPGRRPGRGGCGGVLRDDDAARPAAAVAHAGAAGAGRGASVIAARGGRGWACGRGGGGSGGPGALAPCPPPPHPCTRDMSHPNPIQRRSIGSPVLSSLFTSNDAGEVPVFVGRNPVSLSVNPGFDMCKTEEVRTLMPVGGGWVWPPRHARTRLPIVGSWEAM